ncbi:tripartite motif-containing protein 64-like isoform X1 [Notamacropus eugenii]|uniref:tripartite motif-containing protein 64-like isoform X1 n=1 Tax=Notamacropus eugenii TaxID=9315 RepID=UPI003B671E02
MEKLQELQNEIICAICRGYFSEPVTITCGHSFCRACLSWSWRVGPTAFSCPECRQVPQVRELPVVNDCLAQLTDLSRELCSLLLQSAEGQRQCVRHKKALKLFCEDDQIPICVRCSQSPEHGAHKLSPVEEAAHNCKKKLQHLWNHVGKHLEEAQKLLTQEERSAVDWDWVITGEYNRLHHFLMEEESQCLERMRQEERARQDRLSQHMQTLQDLMQELQEAGHQPNVELLQEVKQLLGRSGSVLSQRAKAIIPELREYHIPGMIEMLSHFKVDITMVPTSVSPFLTVSEDKKSVKAREGWKLETKHPEDTVCHYVFAEQAFSSGRQYWEVDVTQLPQWILGIHTPYLRRKRGRNVDSCTSTFLLCCVKKEEDYYLQTHPGSLDHRVKGPVLRVGVYLEHNPGTLVFYNVLQRTLIYRFYPILFTAPVTPIFCPGPPLPGIKSGPMTLCPVDSHLCACCYSRL